MTKPILVLAPHTDDGEIGCGGTIAKFIEEREIVYYLAFSTAQTSIRKGLPKNILEIEVKKATSVLGIPENRLIVFDYDVRHFPKHRQEILEQLVRIRSELNPKLILTPSPNDIHQDHQVITNEALRAFKQLSILGYEEPWNNIVFETRAFNVLEKRHIEKKVEALMCYESQKHRTYLDENFLWSMARMRGTQIEGTYAEAFEVLRWIL